MAGCTLATWPAAMRTASSIWWTERRTLSSLAAKTSILCRSRISSAIIPRCMDVAVIGLPDKRLGEIAAAIIQVADGETCTEEEINAVLPGTAAV